LWIAQNWGITHITISPYNLQANAHPILSLDVKEATWLVEPLTGVMTEADLVGMRARALARHQIHVEEMRKRVDADKLKRLKKYERDFRAVIKDYKFEPGDLVLVRNTAIESSLDKKMKPRYTGPMIVVAVNRGGSYIVVEMSGAVRQQKVAKVRVVPYFARRKIDIPEGIMNIIDSDEVTLEKIWSQPDEDKVLDSDYLMDGVRIGKLRQVRPG
jgi:ribosomal protein L21E